MTPPSEMVHWLFASGFLFVGLLRLSEAVVSEDVWCRRRWRAYVWPGLVFAIGVFMWPVMTFFTNSAIHMLAHSAWAQVMMAMGAVELARVHGRLHSRWWTLVTPLALLVSGTAFLVHEQNDWLFARSAFLHHLIGWTLVIGALLPLGLVFRPTSVVLRSGFALLFVVVSVMLFCDRDVAPVFGHLSPLAGTPHR